MEANHKIAVVLGTCALVFSSFALSANDEEGKAEPFVSCGSVTEPQIAAQVKSDFMHNRLPRWAEEKATLGKKAVAWVNDSEVTKTETGYTVPLVVRGAKSDLRYSVSVDCQNNTVTYNATK
ncbi:protein YebF [Providencia huashanensis]|uniref:protein YebF n=1 Tax=Providencia huashanensis TaxID=3037798 RepID=UPI002AFE8086|nr:protein YebF [Providencia sp. 3007]